MIWGKRKSNYNGSGVSFVLLVNALYNQMVQENKSVEENRDTVNYIQTRSHIRQIYNGSAI